MAQTIDEVSTPAAGSAQPERPAGEHGQSRDPSGRLTMWLAIIGVPIALVASIGAFWQAKATDDALEDDRRAARFETARQVVVLGPTASKGELSKDPNAGGDTGFGPGVDLNEVPNLVQNYARLPVSEMTIAMDLKYEDSKAETFEIPVGSLPPCRQVGITDGGNLRSEIAKGVTDVITYVYFVDPMGHKWKRYVGQEPVEVSTVPEIYMDASNGGMVVRTDIQRIDPCG